MYHYEYIYSRNGARRTVVRAVLTGRPTGSGFKLILFGFCYIFLRFNVLSLILVGLALDLVD